MFTIILPDMGIKLTKCVNKIFEQEINGATEKSCYGVFVNYYRAFSDDCGN